MSLNRPTRTCRSVKYFCTLMEGWPACHVPRMSACSSGIGNARLAGWDGRRHLVNRAADGVGQAGKAVEKVPRGVRHPVPAAVEAHGGARVERRQPQRLVVQQVLRCRVPCITLCLPWSTSDRHRCCCGTEVRLAAFSAGRAYEAEADADTSSFGAKQRAQ